MTATESLAHALHESDDTCNANYYLPFEECATKEYDLDRAAEVMDILRREGWTVAPYTAGTIAMDLS